MFALQMGARIPAALRRPSNFPCPDGVRRKQRQYRRGGVIAGSSSPLCKPPSSPAVAGKADDAGGEKDERARFRGHGKLAVVIQDGPNRMVARIHAPIAQRRVAVPRSNSNEIIVAAAEIAKHGWLPVIVGQYPGNPSGSIRPGQPPVRSTQSFLRGAAGCRSFAARTYRYGRCRSWSVHPRPRCRVKSTTSLTRPSFDGRCPPGHADRSLKHLRFLPGSWPCCRPCSGRRCP